MIAIVSDIHGNLEALDAVLEDIEKFAGVEAIYCLGDLVGYGPDPLACVRKAMQWEMVLLGNHDSAFLNFADDLSGYPAILSRMLLRNRAELLQHPLCAELTGFLRDLKPESWCQGNLFVHGSPRHPLNEYVFPEDVYNDQKMAGVMDRFGTLCFCGHTHLPGVFRRSATVPTLPARQWGIIDSLWSKRTPVTPKWDYLSPEEFDFELPIAGEQLLCNVGSVGQPRDNDPRACYVLLSAEKIEFRRIEYDVEQTVAKLRSVPDGDFYGERLRIGR